MKSWQTRLLEPFIEPEQERDWEIDASVGAHGGGLIPMCYRCSKLSGRRVNVQEVCVTDWGGKDGGYWTESKARCHLAEDTIRIPGVDWCHADKWTDQKRTKIMAVMSLLPYFTEGLEREVKVERLTHLLLRGVLG
jgi:hypothetical protein